mgnify:CR=1 FL=1
MIPYDRQVMLHANIIIHILHVDIVNLHLNITVNGRGEGVCHLKDDICNLICATFSLSFSEKYIAGQLRKWKSYSYQKVSLTI